MGICTPNAQPISPPLPPPSGCRLNSQLLIAKSRTNIRRGIMPKAKKRQRLLLRKESVQAPPGKAEESRTELCAWVVEQMQRQRRSANVV